VTGAEASLASFVTLTSAGASAVNNAAPNIGHRGSVRISSENSFLAPIDLGAFAGADDAKARIRAAVAYLLKAAAGSDRGDIMREIIEIVNEVARGLEPGRSDPFDDELPGG
jgi:hypothetical protein